MSSRSPSRRTPAARRRPRPRSGVGRSGRIEGRADDGLGHGGPAEVPHRPPVRVGHPAGRRPETPAVHVHEHAIGIGPIDEAVAAVAAADVRPNRPGRGPGRAVVLQPGEEDVRVGRMLGDEVAAEAGRPLFWLANCPVPPRVAVEEHAAVAGAPELVRVARRVDHACTSACACVPMDAAAWTRSPDPGGGVFTPRRRLATTL